MSKLFNYERTSYNRVNVSVADGDSHTVTNLFEIMDNRLTRFIKYSVDKDDPIYGTSFKWEDKTEFFDLLNKKESNFKCPVEPVSLEEVEIDYKNRVIFKNYLVSMLSNNGSTHCIQVCRDYYYHPQFDASFTSGRSSYIDFYNVRTKGDQISKEEAIKLINVANIIQSKLFREHNLPIFKYDKSKV